MKLIEPIASGAGIARGPVTQRELDGLRRRLQQPPVAEPHLTPGGFGEQSVKRFQRESDAIRASYVNNRLRRIEGRVRHEFSRGELRGNARKDFERSR